MLIAFHSVHLHERNSVQVRLARWQLHLEEHFSWHAHLISCLQALAASGTVAHTGSQLCSFHFHPQAAGEGMLGWVSAHVAQIPAWYAAL